MVEALHLFSLWIVLLPAITGAVLFKKLQPTGKLIWLVCLLACFPQLLRYVTTSAPASAIFYNAYTLLECCLFALFFSKVAPLQKSILQVSLVFMAVVGGMAFFQTLSTGFSDRFYSGWVVVTNLYFTMASMMILYQLIDRDIDHETTLSHHLFIGAIIIYAPITLIIFSIWRYLKNNSDAALQDLWIIHHIANCILYLLFFLGIIFNTNLIQKIAKTHD